MRTSELLPHDPAHLITRESPVVFDPAAAGEFPARLAEIFQGDAALADWFRREIGMAATGFDQAKRIYFLCGDLDQSDANGDNGKSLVVDTIRAALDSYAGGIKSALFCRPTFDRDANSHDAGRQGLIGNRLALGSEFPTGSRLNDAEFNELSGGEPIRARMQNQPDEIEFPAQATIVISTNTVPALGTANRSTRERLTPVPFFARFHKPGEPVPAGGMVADYGLKARLLSEPEQRAVLAWIVSGARDFYATGTPAPLPAAVLALKAHIFREQDEFAEFLDGNTMADPAGSITRQDLRRLAEAYFGPMNRAAEMRLSAAMKARRYESASEDSATRRWIGLSVKTRAAAILGTMRSKATTVAPTLRVVASQVAPMPAPTSVPAPIQAAPAQSPDMARPVRNGGQPSQRTATTSRTLARPMPRKRRPVGRLTLRQGPLDGSELPAPRDECTALGWAALWARANQEGGPAADAGPPPRPLPSRLFSLP